MAVPERDFERGMAALIPFVQAWKLPLNPEDVAEMVFAVLTHVGSDASSVDIDAAVRQQLADYAFRQRSFGIEAYRGASAEEAAVRVLVELLAEGEFETVELATRGSRVTADDLRVAVGERTLAKPDAEWWASVTVTPLSTTVGGGLHVTAPLGSDLTLELWLIPRVPSGYDASIEALSTAAPRGESS